MFEALRAARAAKITLSNMTGPATRAEHRAWSCTILFYGAIVGSASGSARKNEFTLVLNKGLQDQIIQNLKSKGFELDLSKIPKSAIKPDTPTNYMCLAIAQIADEMDLVKELKAQATAATLVVFKADAGKVEVFPLTYSQKVKDDLVKRYGAENFEILNESIKDL
ncbi:hypothetical protein [Pseudomonas putida]|uniref:hypothetical protein n=1 Tax=Pseudomonas putida TaxID=303 RepID=UPI002B24CB15|nr:hypothetical protein [Pseudomonas putida]